MNEKGRAFTSLVMFVIGFIIVYKFFNERSIYICVVVGWLFGGTIWGWFITGKWFRPHRETGKDTDNFYYAAKLTFRCMLAPCVGAVVMTIELVKFLMAFFKFCVNRANAKKAGDSIKAEDTENE